LGNEVIYFGVVFGFVLVEYLNCSIEFFSHIELFLETRVNFLVRLAMVLVSHS